MKDLPWAEEDAENVKKNLTKFGFESEEIIEVAHPLKEDLRNTWRVQIEDKIMSCQRQKKRMFVFVYFAGHGYINDRHETCIMLNDANPELNFYTLEGMVRSVGSSPRLYMLVLFDCCRISFDKQKEKESVLRSGPQAEEENKDGENLIMVFGCKPDWTVKGKSTLVVDLFQSLSNSADERGYVPLPGNLIYFKTQDKRNELTIRVTQPILLKKEI